MKSKPILLITTLLLTVSLSALASDAAPKNQDMDGAAISATLPNMTMTGNYGDGTTFTETYHDDGSITYEDETVQDKGRWFVRGDLFCTFYETSNGACFSVKRKGENCFEYFIQEEEDGSPSAAPGAWNSIGWDKNKPSTCDIQSGTV